jgi:hypothetical protein
MAPSSEVVTVAPISFQQGGCKFRPLPRDALLGALKFETRSRISSRSDLGSLTAGNRLGPVTARGVDATRAVLGVEGST